MFRCPTSRRLLQRAFSFRTATQPLHPSTSPSALSHRCFTTTPTVSFPRKESQDKDSIDRRSTEYSQSGTDDDAASSSTAFDPNQTKPETEQQTTSQEGGGDSLNASPSNSRLSKARPKEEQGREDGIGTKQSGGGSPQKSGDGKHS